MNPLSVKNSSVDSSNYVPPGKLRALRSIFCFFDHSQVIERVPSSSRKRNDVVNFVLSRIKFLARLTLPFRYDPAPHVCGNPPIRIVWTGPVGNDKAEKNDSPRWRSDEVVLLENQIFDCSHDRSQNHPFHIEKRVVAARPNEHYVKEYDYRSDCPIKLIVPIRWHQRRDRRNGGIDLRTLPPKGKFGSSQVSLSGMEYVNAAMLASA